MKHSGQLRLRRLEPQGIRGHSLEVPVKQQKSPRADYESDPYRPSVLDRIPSPREDRLPFRFSSPELFSHSSGLRRPSPLIAVSRAALVRVGRQKIVCTLRPPIQSPWFIAEATPDLWGLTAGATQAFRRRRVPEGSPPLSNQSSGFTRPLTGWWRRRKIEPCQGNPESSMRGRCIVSRDEPGGSGRGG